MTDQTPTIAGYARVSTTEQTLDRQLTGIFQYAEREFNINCLVERKTASG